MRKRRRHWAGRVVQVLRTRRGGACGAAQACVWRLSAWRQHALGRWQVRGCGWTRWRSWRHGWPAVLLWLLFAGAVATAWPLAQRLRWELTARRLHDFDALIAEAALAHRLPVRLVRAVVAVESSGDPLACSPKGAIGLMQITAITHTEVVDRLRLVADGDLRDPVHNVHVGCAYLRWLLDRFGADQDLALAAYNWGPTAVRRWCARRAQEGLPADGAALREAADVPEETRTYLRRIHAWLEA